MTDDCTHARLRAMQAHELHEAVPGPHAESVPVPVQEKKRLQGSTDLSTFNWEMSVHPDLKYFNLSGIGHQRLHMDRKQMDELIALLQRAREIMQGGVS